MRVLMTTDTVGGVWQYALTLCRGLAGDGGSADGNVEIALAAMGPGSQGGGPCSPEQYAEAAAVPGLTLHQHVGRLLWMSDSATDVARAGEWLRDIAADVRPDVIHFNDYAHAAPPWRAPTIVVGHSCVLSWWEAVKGERAPASWRAYQRCVHDGLQAARLVVSPSRAMLRALERHYGPLRSTRVIANGRDAHAFTPGTKQPIVFAAGRLWDEAKNLAALDAVAGDLSWPVCIAGDTRHPEGYDVVARHARLMGRLAPRDVALWMSRASIYAWPAKYEPFGLTVLEAALSACALVLGDIPSLRELWDGAAIFVPPADHDALREALEGLIASPSRRAAIARTAHTRALELSTSRMVGAYRHVYRELIGAGTSSATRAAAV